MAHFTDTKGRRWPIAINIAVARQVRDRLEVDLLDQDITKVLGALFEDHIRLVDVLYIVATENSDHSSRVTEEDFGRAMSGDSIEEGSVALMHALRDFTPSPRARARVGKMVASVERAMTSVHDQADKLIDELTAKFENEVSGLLSSDSPELPESSPGDTPSGS